ncbi:MAG: hypothetical protein H6558_07460 [Lewinellaceae bacterium]|nr:hypothetical protein [Lewinellaceae bacterium]MCB9286406.1 hypothetical protein [Lewinellaceae bacterium]
MQLIEPAGQAVQNMGIFKKTFSILLGRSNLPGEPTRRHDENPAGSGTGNTGKTC